MSGAIASSALTQAIAAVRAPTPRSRLASAAASSIASGPAGVQATSIQTSGPLIVVTSPTRGTFTTDGAVLVKGNVWSLVGVSALTINGSPATFNAGGDFSEPVTLSVGLNVIDVQAFDAQGVCNRVSLSVIQGQFQPDGQAIPNALAVRLNQGSLDAASRAIASQLSGKLLAKEVIAQNPLVHSSGWWGSTKITCTSASFGNPTIALTPEQGDLHVHFEAPTADLELKEVGSWNIPNCTGHVSCSNAVLDAQVTVTVADGKVTTAIVNDQVNLQGFNWGINGLPDFITGIFSGLVRDAVQSRVAKTIKSKLPGEINKMIAGATGKPITHTILGSQATFDLTPNSISIDANGLNAAVDADCSLAAISGYTPLPAPGSLLVGGAPPQNGGPGPDLFASINEDLLNRAGYAVWQSGVAVLHIDDSPSSSVKMPASYPLDFGLMLTFLPELLAVPNANATDPIALTITPLLPPVFRARPAPNTIEADLGELCCQFTDTVTNTTILTLAAHVRVPAQVLLNGNNTFDIHLSDRPVVDVSLVSSAAPQLNTIGVDNLAAIFLPTVLQLAGNQWSGFPLPTYPGLTPASTSIYWDGPQETFVTAAADFDAGGAPLPTGKPDPRNLSRAAVIALVNSLATSPATVTAVVPATQSVFSAATAAYKPAMTRGPQSFVRVALSALGSTTTSPPAPTPPSFVANSALATGFSDQITSTTGYVALVEDGLETAVAPLLSDYQARGTTVALVPLSHVVAQGADRAEEIRNWLIAQCNDGVKRFLLLVGGPTAIPFRTCQPSAAVGPVVTDLFYGDLQGNWDVNGNGVYGELADAPNFDAQLHVGRIPFDDAPSVTTAIAAIEKARNGTGAWTNNCFLAAGTTLFPGDDPVGAETAKSLAFEPQGWDVKTAYGPEAWEKGDLVLGSTTIVDELTARRAALVVDFSHGSETRLMSHPDANTWLDLLTVPQLAEIPTDQPPVMVSVACNTANPRTGPCIGSLSLQNGLAGWLGCTVKTDPRTGGGAWLLGTVQICEEIAAGKSLGEARDDMVRDFVATSFAGVQGNPDAQALVFQQGMCWVLYGDPGLCVGPKAR
jgi:hypothetical protein